jgi:hypothetical protein
MPVLAEYDIESSRMSISADDVQKQDGLLLTKKSDDDLKITVAEVLRWNFVAHLLEDTHILSDLSSSLQRT